MGAALIESRCLLVKVTDFLDLLVESPFIFDVGIQPVAA
jgi:hypothetical protein